MGGLKSRMDKEIFSQIMTNLRPQMLTLAERLLSDKAEAEDAVQDALLKLWQLGCGEGIANTNAFAMTVVRNLCVDRLRRRRRLLDISKIEIDEENELALQDGEAEMIERLMVMMERLPNRQQAILKMRHIDGLKTREIATLIGASEVSVRQTLSRARRRIFIAMTAVVALLFGLGTILRNSLQDTENICVTYENGQTITDEATVIANMEQTMTDIFQSGDVPDIDQQMNDLLK